jgi:hypothetical protein
VRSVAKQRSHPTEPAAYRVSVRRDLIAVAVTTAIVVGTDGAQFHVLGWLALAFSVLICVALSAAVWVRCSPRPAIGTSSAADPAAASELTGADPGIVGEVEGSRRAAQHSAALHGPAGSRERRTGPGTGLLVLCLLAHAAVYLALGLGAVGLL